MLALTRRAGQSILIGRDVEVHVVRIDGDRVVLGVRAPREVPVMRTEVVAQVEDEVREAAGGRAGVLEVLKRGGRDR